MKIYSLNLFEIVAVTDIQDAHKCISFYDIITVFIVPDQK
jgi:hypothetical protein